MRVRRYPCLREAERRSRVRPLRPTHLRSRQAWATVGAGGLGRPPGADLSGLPGRPAGLGFELGHVRGVRRDAPLGDAR